MTAEQWIIQSLNGISYGMLLFMLAVGLSLIFGLMGVINLAHGSFYLLGAYLGLTIAKKTGSFLLALIAAAVVIGLLGSLMERYFIRRLYRQELDQVLLTFGFAYIFMDLAKWIWGGDPQSLAHPALLSGSVNIVGLTYPIYRLAVIVIGIVAALVIWLLQEKTKAGAIVRAGVDDREMIAGLGVNIKLVFTLVFAFGAALAAIGGVIGGPIIGVYPGLDSDVLVLALVVVVVGGLGTLQGALAGSLIIGLIDTLGKILFPTLSVFTVYAGMACILLLRPTGLVGRGPAR